MNFFLTVEDITIVSHMCDFYRVYLISPFILIDIYRVYLIDQWTYLKKRRRKKN